VPRVAEKAFVTGPYTNGVRLSWWPDATTPGDLASRMAVGMRD
jgi:hypothetical protein